MGLPRKTAFESRRCGRKEEFPQWHRHSAPGPLLREVILKANCNKLLAKAGRLQSEKILLELRLQNLEEQHRKAKRMLRVCKASRMVEDNSHSVTKPSPPLQVLLVRGMRQVFCDIWRAFVSSPPTPTGERRVRSSRAKKFRTSVPRFDH